MGLEDLEPFVVNEWDPPSESVIEGIILHKILPSVSFFSTIVRCSGWSNSIKAAWTLCSSLLVELEGMSVHL